MFSSSVDCLEKENLKFKYICKTGVKIFAGTLFLSVTARLSLPLPFTPVPLSLQTFGIYLLGILLGSKRGALAVLIYFIQGAVGLPVFAGGASGIIRFFGVSGGYLVAFLPGIMIAGLYRDRDETMLGSPVKYLLGSFLCIASSGALVLSCFLGCKNGVLLGIVPFIIPEIVKISAVISIVRGMHRLKNLGCSWMF